MGSQFVVVVPIRDHEALLRQKEHNIRIIDSDSVDRGGQIHVPSGEIGSGTTMSTATGSTTGSQLLHNPEEVDIYNAIVDGNPVKVVVSGDSMAIITAKHDYENLGQDNKRKSSMDEKGIQNAIENTFLEKHLEDCLLKFSILNACWGQSVDGNYSQISFTVSADKSEVIINHLQTVGIGKKYESTICVCAAAVYYEPEMSKKGDSQQQVENSQKTQWNDFVASIKSRLTVAQVVQSVKAQAIITFDFIILILVAGMIAGLGLIDDSSVNVVASMLVSPLMGPIMAATFGFVIRDWELVKIGIKSELVGLALCLGVGYLFGILLQIDAYPGPWRYVKTWPTDQMVARGELRALAVGVLVAIPSGAGVALSILAGNSGSLVGVAISASLLPPAVNCGIFWGLATVVAINEQSRNYPLSIGGCKGILKTDSDPKTENYTRLHTPIHCTNTLYEYFFMGLNSFGLTWINIVVIFAVGVIILKIKEVAPYTTRRSLNRFWKEDLKIARQFNVKGKQGSLMDDLNETGEGKDIILTNLENDATFNAVNRRAGNTSNILADVRRRNMVGSLDDIHGTRSKLKQQTSSPQEPTNTGNGWFSSLFGASSSSTPAQSQANLPLVEEGQSRHRPKLQ